jgi:hypothetical protein
VVTNREPLFWRQWTAAIFYRTLAGVWRRFTFEMREVWLVEEWPSFYIRPTDGLQLPAIMRWLKQTFSVCFNLHTGRTGHIWGDRYRSRIVEGEPPEGTEEVDWEATGVLSSGTCLPAGASPPGSGKTGGNPAQTPSARPSENGIGRGLSNKPPQGALGSLIRGFEQALMKSTGVTSCFL